MMFKMYVNNGVYRLDKQKGKGKIYEIINKSKAKQIKKIFSKPSFADVSSGCYEFYIGDYNLCLNSTMGSVNDIFTFLYRIITQRENIFMTIDDEGIYHYIVAIHLENNKVRLVFLDRKEPKCRDWSTRYGDTELKNTIAAQDIIIKKTDLIKQFNDEFKRIYDENKYYISKEYHDKCDEKKEILCQEYVLEYFEKYIQKFDKYLKRPKKFWEESFFSIKNWNVKTYKTVPELKEYFYNLEKQNLIIGTKLEKIMILGIIFNDDRSFHTYRNGKWYANVFDSSKKHYIKYVEADEPLFNPNKCEDVSLTLDEPVSIFFDNGGHFDIDFTKTARFMIEQNSFDFWEKSQIFPDIIWQDVSKYFSKNIIGHKVVNINIEAYSSDDENIDLVEFVMDNGYKLSLETDLFTEYMSLSEEKPENIGINKD